MEAKRKKFDAAFKVNAVKSSYEKNSVKAFSEELGISPNLVWRWRNEYRKFGEGSFKGPGYDRFHPKDRQIVDLSKKERESELRYEILKKASPYLYQGNTAIYRFIRENEHRYSILRMCQVLEVGYGRYHRWKKNGISEKQLYIIRLKETIESLFLKFKKHYGRNRLTEELHKLGYKICKEQVSFYMRELGLRRVKKRKFKITTDSKHDYNAAPNVLNRQFNAAAPSKAWVSDITYIQTCRGFLYLTIIMDLYDRKIIGWSLGNKLFAGTTILPAWRMAAANRQIPAGMVFHSDRGVQYASRAFRRLLEKYGCIQSMSRKGDHLDNAVSEAFFSSFKRELLDRKGKLLSQKKMKIDIYGFIENWYNRERIHTSLGYKTIPQFNADNSVGLDNGQT
ncbi:transposase InsO family protein/transposase-like protein [Flavobacterium nitrogenifigens]|uniref:Transposase InsO family protein/transposase-like protein n=2 Tax=Flavobacterium TaxID=237 RepID=A0A7W7N863_9FLAO|nr:MULTISPECIES: IS3 family transposase [Flavobacterium]MBB4802052.1 transposase InsO family protein/transposase-like protein [Flavobacterium nitrogenifigens]MBB6387010.1 transposase InsO family protein/transposase-like protein [Flavobacterium notoginsengisoli]